MYWLTKWMNKINTRDQRYRYLLSIKPLFGIHYIIKMRWVAVRQTINPNCYFDCSWSSKPFLSRTESFRISSTTSKNPAIKNMTWIDYFYLNFPTKKVKKKTKINKIKKQEKRRMKAWKKQNPQKWKINSWNLMCPSEYWIICF